MSWFVVLLAFLLVACTSASTETTITKGAVTLGVPLAVGHIVAPEAVSARCGRANQPTLACAWTTWVVVPALGRPVGSCNIVFPRAIQVESGAYETVVHELCHCVAQLQSIAPDPCHAEDHGVIDWRP